jgi:hypothetical protein
VRTILVVVFVAASTLACTDLFHSTADILDKCQIDAAACPLDFCSLTPQAAENAAQHACAWLGACESPLGGNAFGPCMVEARLAFDCKLNPNHEVKGQRHDLWECMAGVHSCDGVRSCISAGPIPCPEQPASGCLNTGSSSARVTCADGGALIENCTLWGTSCAIDDASAAHCGAGPGGSLACGSAGSRPGSCDRGSEKVYWCTSAGEVELDCSGMGPGECGVFPEAGSVSSWAACVPDSDAGCGASLSATCANDIATSCATGLSETIDCAHLLGARGSCNTGALDPPFDWTSPCSLGAPCHDDCDGGVLTGCARGALFATDCSQAGLGDCRMVTTGDDDAGPRAACSAP